MITKSLFKKTFKNNFKFCLVITGLLTLFIIMMMAVGNNVADRGGRQENAGRQIITMYYNNFALMLPMIYILMTGNKLISAQVDRGSLAYVMAKPIKRNQVSITQAVYFIGSILTMFAIITLMGVVMISVTNVEIEMEAFLLLNLGIVIFHLAISGISYAASCIFNSSRYSLLIGAGIPIAFFIFNMLASFGEFASWMENFKYFTLLTLYNTVDIVAYSSNMIWQFLILLAVAIGGYAVGIIYFKKKDLPL